MNEKTFTRRLKSLLIFMIAVIFGQSTWADVLVHWPLTSNNTPDTYIPANIGITFTSSLTGATFSSAGEQVTGWTTSNSYWTSQAFSTLNYLNVSVQAQMKSDQNGPQDFQLQYKVGSGKWTNIGAITATQTEGSVATITLPSECSNQSSVSIRYLNSDNTGVNGTLKSGAKSYIRNVEVDADLPLAPTSQVNSISLVSETPTTITITANTTGDHWILMMNKTNNFTPPISNSNPSSNLIYDENAGIQQVMANSISSIKTFKVTVGNATNQYYFRAFAYNDNDGMTRYNTIELTPTTLTSNPKLCALENIHSPTFINVKLTSATLGATISDPARGIISERGIFWSTNSGVTENDNGAVEGNTSTGTFTTNVDGLDRGTTIYFKGYVVNESGMILSEESSFSNVPVFTGTGIWEDYTHWNVQEIPGSGGQTFYGSNGDIADSPIINGNCTLTVPNSVTNLTVNSGGSLTISAGDLETGNTLNVAGTLTNNAGNAGIHIKSAAGLANGSLIWTNGNPDGTVDMYSKAYTDTKYHWQYFGIPVTSMTAGNGTFSGTGVRIRKYNEANIDPTGNDVGLWLPSAAGATMATTNETMSPVVGYEVTLPTAGTLTFAGTLNHDDITNYPLGNTTGADWQGSNIIANPYTAAINISSISSVGTDGNVYLYNAGSRDEWSSNIGASTDGTSPGQYTVSNGHYANTLGTPAQIPSMQGFLVKAIAPSPTITIPYSSLTTIDTPQRVKAATTDIAGTRIDVLGTNYSDKMWIFADPTCTRKFDTGYDGPKLLGSALTPQLFAMEEDGNYQIDAVDDINNTYLGFQAGSETNLKLVFTHQNLDTKYASIYLVDLLENKTVDITASGTEYAFTAVSTPTAIKRFQVITTPLSTTSVNTLNGDAKLKVFSSQRNVFIQNFTGKAGNIVLFNMAGVEVRNAQFNANGITTISNFAPGVYISEAKSDSMEVKTQLIIR